MAPIALKLNDVSKLYRLGEVGTGTLAHDLNRLWARTTGREDPGSKVGEINDREQVGGDYVWALRDVSFEVEQGEVIGVIGRNGAGKSTLLKLLSRVTAPTEGSIHINGRIASLLEIGTGFHPDLTGRENIFLNGAILGMSKREIRARFDEIVDFSGCAKYIDTPVKRYSSGMYVRLAFAVAAHLETDVLIVDEVLAVGDGEFQRKCLGKMSEFASGGRTVIFVSHNMSAVQALTQRCVLLRNGAVAAIGPSAAVIAHYSSAAHGVETTDVRAVVRHSPHLGTLTRICEIKPSPDNGDAFLFGEPLKFKILARLSPTPRPIRCGITISDVGGAPIMTVFSSAVKLAGGSDELALELTVPDTGLAPGSYSLDLSIGEGGRGEARVEYDVVKNGPTFAVASVSTASQPLFRWMKEYGTISRGEARLKFIGNSGSEELLAGVGIQTARRAH